MKRLLLAALAAALPLLGMAAGNDVLMNQRNAADTATLSRVIAHPPGGQNGILGFNGATVLPQFFIMGSGLNLSGGTLSAPAPDWSAIPGKPSFATVATTGAYGDLSGRPTLFSGAYADLTGVPATFAPAPHTHAAGDVVSGVLADARIPALAISKTTGLQAALDAKLATPIGTVSQYLRGDGSLATFPTVVSAFSNDSGYLTSISAAQISAALGFTPYSAANPAGYVSQAGARSAVSLTTTGTSGAATYNSSTGVLNIPNYAPGTGTVTSVTAGTGLSGGTITTTGTISMPNVGTAGTYANVTTDAQGRVTGGTNRSFANPTRALNTAFQVSATRDAHVTYTVDVSVTSLLLAGTSGRVVLEYADDVGMATNVVQVNSSPNATGGVLNVTNLGPGNVSGWIPAGKYARIRTVSTTGTPTFTFQLSQEVLQ